MPLNNNSKIVTIRVNPKSLANNNSNAQTAPPRRRQKTRREVLYKSLPNPPLPPRDRRVNNQLSNKEQLGAVVRTRLTKLGVSDIKGLRVAWVAGYTFVGDSSNGGALNKVYFQDATQAHIWKGFTAGGSTGLVPILPSDTNVGQSYIADIEKHFSRKRIKRMWIHVDSLQPSTSNNMMCVIGPRRGFGVAFSGDAVAQGSGPGLALAPNTVANVSSMKDAMCVDSWESKCLDLTPYIAGGSGANQNEFEISALAGITTTVGNTTDLDGVSPAGFAIAGNSTTDDLQNTQVHQVVIEQEIDLLDYIGGMAQSFPLE
jgi:hypothetical protein